MEVAEAQPALSAEVKSSSLSTSTDLALERTFLTAGRTHGLDPVRSGHAVFGFTIYKFLWYVRASLSATALRAQGPRRFGLSLIFLGTLCTTFGLIESAWCNIGAIHRRKTRRFVIVSSQSLPDL